MSFLRRLALSLAVLWIRSLRPRFENSASLPSSGILVLWHEHMLLCLPAFARRNMRVLISSSRDGEWGARAAEKLGYRTVRGSSSRGGPAALKKLARDLSTRSLSTEGGWIALVVDGPRGPRRVAKPGAFWLSQATGLPVVAVSARTASGFSLNGWDRCRVPFPGARIRLRCAPAFRPVTTEEIDAVLRDGEANLAT